MSRYRLVFWVALLLLGAAGAARAEPGVAVLGIEPNDVPQSLAQQLTDALRQRAAATNGIRVVPGKDLIEMKMVFGCDAEAPQCLAQAGRSLDADKLLYGSVKRASAGRVTVNLKLLDVSSGTVERFVNETVPKRDLAAGNVRGQAARWFSALLQIESRPTLTILSEPSNAAVAVDGRSRGRTPLTLRDLAAGQHTVKLSLSGHAAATRSVDLRAGGSHDVVVTLEPLTPPPVPQPPPEAQPPAQAVVPPLQPPLEPRASHPGRTAKIIALSALAGAAVSAGVAIYTWRTYAGLEDTAKADLADVQLHLAAQPAPGSPEDVFLHKSPSCSPPSGLANAQGISKFKSDCSSGNTYANATTALWVVTGALGATSIISYVIGSVQAAHARERSHSTLGVMRQTLRIAPVVMLTGGALSASFEF